jgi:acetyl esterase/lipase
MSIVQAQQITIPLYEGKIPNSRPGMDEESVEYSADGKYYMVIQVSRPTLSVYLPPEGKANGAAILVCPGGGYRAVAMMHEGDSIARRLNSAGIAAFVLKYRLPDDRTMVNKNIGPLQDAQRAMQIIREKAGEWRIDPHRVGVMGFSAGGHLASTLGTHLNHVCIENKKGTNLRPDFMILVYPVISLEDSIGHIGSRENLIGKNPGTEKIWEYSNELQVTTQTPPAFLVHAKNDETVPVQNSIDFYEALHARGGTSEIYLYDQGGHGFGLTNPSSSIRWMDLAIAWMRKNGWLGK